MKNGILVKNRVCGQTIQKNNKAIVVQSCSQQGQMSIVIIAIGVFGIGIILCFASREDILGLSLIFLCGMILAWILSILVVRRATHKKIYIFTHEGIEIYGKRSRFIRYESIVKMNFYGRSKGMVIHLSQYQFKDTISVFLGDSTIEVYHWVNNHIKGKKTVEINHEI